MFLASGAAACRAGRYSTLDSSRPRYLWGMGLINARNLRKAKELLDKNRHKVGDIVDKAGEKIDKVSGGKTANVTSKAADAAKKYSAGGTSGYGTQVPVDSASFHQGGPVDPAVSQAQANAAATAAANAVTAAATAAANLMNNAAVQATLAQARQESGRNSGAGEKVQATHDPTGGRDHGSDRADDSPTN